MTGNFHVRFLGGRERETAHSYPVPLRARPLRAREYQDSISLGAPCVGRHCRPLFLCRIFLSLAEDRSQYVEGMVADEHRQFEDGAPICRGDPTISRLAFCLSGCEVGHIGRSSWIPHLCFCIFVSTMTWPKKNRCSQRRGEVLVPLRGSRLLARRG